jgi:hypothetical protein
LCEVGEILFDVVELLEVLKGGEFRGRLRRGSCRCESELPCAEFLESGSISCCGQIGRSDTEVRIGNDVFGKDEC